jgi:hypothetical protein
VGQTIHFLNFFLWGYVKNKVCATIVTGVENLKTQIKDVITTLIGASWLAYGTN